MDELLGMIFFVSGNAIELVSLFSCAALQEDAPEDQVSLPE
jgi:hypothetical protein